VRSPNPPVPFAGRKSRRYRLFRHGLAARTGARDEQDAQEYGAESPEVISIATVGSDKINRRRARREQRISA